MLLKQNENKLVVAGAEEGGEDGEIGEGNWEAQTSSYKINKLQGGNVQHREYSQ